MDSWTSEHRIQCRSCMAVIDVGIAPEVSGAESLWRTWPRVINGSRGFGAGLAELGPRAAKLRTNGSEEAGVAPIALRTRAPSGSVPAQLKLGVRDE